MFFEICNPFRPDSYSSAVQDCGAEFRKLENPSSNVALSLAGRIAEISDENSNLLIHFAPLFFTETGVFLTQSTPIFGESLHLPRSYGPQVRTSDRFPCQIRTFWARVGVFFSTPNRLEPNQQRGEGSKPITSRYRESDLRKPSLTGIFAVSFCAKRVRSVVTAEGSGSVLRWEFSLVATSAVLARH